METTRVLNLFSHSITFQKENGEDIQFKADEVFGRNDLRCEYSPGDEAQSIMGIRVKKNGPFRLEVDKKLLDHIQDGDVLLVPLLVGNTVESTSETDFQRVFGGKRIRIVSPGTRENQAIRNEMGRVVKSLEAVEYFPRKNIQTTSVHSKQVPAWLRG
jgi:hypothetical protein